MTGQLVCVLTVALATVFVAADIVQVPHFSPAYPVPARTNTATKTTPLVNWIFILSTFRLNTLDRLCGLILVARLSQTPLHCRIYLSIKQQDYLESMDKILCR